MTGAFYGGFAVMGILAFLLIRPQVFLAGDPQASLDAIVGNTALARLGLLLEVGTVVLQVLTALWFFKLFRSQNAFAAASLAVLGLMNAVALLGSAAALSTALQVAERTDGGSAVQASTFVGLSEGFWSVGTVFFGLWLIPMGHLVLRSTWFGRWLGWALIAGGVGYLVSFIVDTLAPEAGLVAELLTIPAIIGEFGMIGYLLVRGVHPRAHTTSSETVAPAGKVEA